MTVYGTSTTADSLSMFSTTGSTNKDDWGRVTSSVHLNGNPAAANVRLADGARVLALC